MLFPENKAQNIKLSGCNSQILNQTLLHCIYTFSVFWFYYPLMFPLLIECQVELILVKLASKEERTGPEVPQMYFKTLLL